MGYTIVYDRLFLRCGERYIPFCLYGASNCTQISYKTGKEILERTWHTFVYCDDMILGTAEQIMGIVRKQNEGDYSDHFKFHSNWLDGTQVIKFFENGLKNAVTVEELRQQAQESLRCFISAYIPDPDANDYPVDERWKHEHHEERATKYPKTTNELIEWITYAKAEKEKMISSGESRSAYINIQCASEEPLTVYPHESLSEPCLLYSARMKGYIASLSKNSAAFAPKEHWEKATVFANAEDAYLAVEAFPFLGAVRIVPLRQLQQGRERNRVILSVLTNGTRKYIEKKTPRWIYFTQAKERAKRFPSESATLKWYKEKIENRVAGATAPEISFI